MFVYELLALMCVYYHVVYTWVFGRYFSTTFSPVRKLPRMDWVSYQLCWMYIIMIFTHKLWGYIFTKLLYRGLCSELSTLLCVQYRVICTKSTRGMFALVIRYAVLILSWYLRKNYWGYVFQTIFPRGSSYRGVCS